jgi:hypothetical protein
LWQIFYYFWTCMWILLEQIFLTSLQAYHYFALNGFERFIKRNPFDVSFRPRIFNYHKRPEQTSMVDVDPISTIICVM